jgi:predicted transport protein
MRSVQFYNGHKYIESPYDSEKSLENIIKNNSKLLFGPTTIYIDLKPRINAVALGESIPDGLLLDLKDLENPEFYLVEVELARHDFYNHIFRQVTKFIAFYRNPQARSQLIEKIFLLIQSDKTLEDEFKRFLKGKEIFKFMKDAADDSQNILLIIDETKPELEESLETYTEWSKMVKRLVLKEYRSGEDRILSLSPDFESAELGEVNEIKTEEGPPGTIPYTEEYHLQGTDNEIKEIYYSIKAKMSSFKPSIRFNPKKYYISIIHKRNFAYIYVRKKKLLITVMLPEKTFRDAIKHHNVHTEGEGVQRFYGGECATVTIENDTNLDEIIDLLKMPISSD